MDLSFSLNVKTVLLGLVVKKQLEIIFLLAKQCIYKALVNNTVTFTAFQKFFKQKYEEQQHLAIISLNLGIVRGSVPGMASSGEGGSCLPLVDSLQYRTLTNCMYWFPLSFQLPIVI